MTLCLVEANPDRPSVFNQLFGLKEVLKAAGLDILVKRGILNRINLADDTDSFFFRCPRLPCDMDAKIGVRRDPRNPNRKQKVFGFNAVIGTCIELSLGIELPVACITIPGNAQEGNQFIPIKKQVMQHGKCSKIDIADAKYDEHHNYEFSRDHGAIPVIHYNCRNEKLNSSALRQRGYDQNGWPYAPCGILTRSNGFDFNCQRASFSCRRQCLLAKDDRMIKFAKDCPFWINYQGFTKHMSIKKFPRLVCKIVRGSYRHQKVKALRSGSERINSCAKEDCGIRGKKYASVLSQMATIVVLIKGIARFIVKITLAFRKRVKENKSLSRDVFIPGPKVKKFILNLIQRE